MILCLILAFTFTEQVQAEPIIVDGKSTGRIYDGIAGVSQGGQSRLVYDYPEPQRSQILDFLFLPHFGMSLQTLKIELGSDSFAGEGAESSHIHSRSELNNPNCNRGYLWWFMEEAKKRNPKITFEALAWGVPGWIGDQQKLNASDPRYQYQKFFTPECRTYFIKFLECAKSRGLEIDVLGILNEAPYLTSTMGRALPEEDYKKMYPGIPLWDPEIAKRWLVEFKKEIKACGFKTRIAAADEAAGILGEAWEPLLTEMEKSKELRDAVDIISVHYPRGATDTRAWKLSETWGKPIWSSEEGASGDLAYGTPPHSIKLLGEWPGARLLPHILNANYINHRITKSELIFMINAFYDSLYAPGCGLMTADAPWSGHYVVQPAVWAVAHTSQFAEPGWQYIDSAAKTLPNGGTIVGLKHDKDYSILAETMDAPQSQKVTFCVKNGLSLDKVYLWRTTKNESFVNIGEAILPDKDGCYSVTLEPETIYSITTTSGQKKGSVGEIPKLTPFPFPYTDTFDEYDLAKGLVPKYLSTQAGAFDLESGKGTSGNCLKQSVTQEAVQWLGQGMGEPYTVLGNKDWTDYKVSVNVAFIEPQGSISLMGRVQGGIFEGSGQISGIDNIDLDLRWRGSYQLTIAPDGQSRLERKDQGNVAVKTWECSSSPTFGTSYHKLELVFDGINIKAYIDDKKVVEVVDTDPKAYLHGMVGLNTSWNEARFDDLSINPITTSVIRIDCNVRGDKLNQFQYTGNGWLDPKQTNKIYFKKDISRNNINNEYVTVRFSGTAVRYRATKGPKNGITAVSVDGGAEAMIDLYGIEDKGNQVVWASPVLSTGEHTLKIRVTDQKNSGSVDTYSTVDAVDVIP